MFGIRESPLQKYMSNRFRFRNPIIAIPFEELGSHPPFPGPLNEYGTNYFIYLHLVNIDGKLVGKYTIERTWVQGSSIFFA